jgi:uncharacterized membrane protein
VVAPAAYEYLDAGEAEIDQKGGPLSAVVFSVLFLQESMTIVQVIGAL